MGKITQINIKNRTYHFQNDTINLDEFDESKIKVDKRSFNDINIYYLGYEYKKKITECNEINSVNPLYLRIKDMKGQFKKGKGDNVWYLIIFGDADVLRKFANIWKSIRAKIEENTGGIVQYDKDYMKIKFESNDNLPTDNIINMHQVTIIVRSVFVQNDKFYPQLFLDDALYELQKSYGIKKLIFQKELLQIKLVHQKNVNFVTIGFSKILDLNLKNMFVINVMIY